jgi:hypothetical protein
MRAIMNTEDVDFIERELSATLPAFYKFYLTSNSDIRFETLVKHREIFLTRDGLVKANIVRGAISSGSPPEYWWPMSYFIIGDKNEDLMTHAHWAINISSNTPNVWLTSYSAEGELQLDLAFEDFEEFLSARNAFWFKESERRRDYWDGFLVDNDDDLRTFCEERFPGKEDIELSIKDMLEFSMWQKEKHGRDGGPL